MTTLDIQHRLVLRATVFFVIEKFGEQPEIEWHVLSLAAGRALISERQIALKEMVASISPEARKAVEQAREIDHLKGGNA